MPAIQAKQITRVFKNGSTELPDPDPDMTVKQVQEHYATAYPEFTTGSFTGPEIEDGRQVYTFQRKVGTKG